MNSDVQSFSGVTIEFDWILVRGPERAIHILYKSRVWGFPEASSFTISCLSNRPVSDVNAETGIDFCRRLVTSTIANGLHHFITY